MQHTTDDGGNPAATGATGTATTTKSHVNGGRFDFDDGGTYCGGWEEGKAHGHGVCTGPKGQGAYSGSWHYGFEVSGVYTWPSGSTFEGQWQNGKRHGLGVESRGRWIYRGEWTQGFKGRYGVRQSNTSTAKYEGTWANGLQDGYGSETYADDGTYQGQWLRGMRHGYGVRNSAPFGKASKYRTANKALRASMTSLRSNEASGAAPDVTTKRDQRVDDSRGGFVLKMNSNEQPRRRSIGAANIKRTIFSGMRRKQKSMGELEKRGVSGSMRSTASSQSWQSTESAQSAMTNASLPSDSNASFVVEDEHMDAGVTETYMGEWKNDKRTGFGVSERSDGLKYEGEWYNNKKYGYGVTTFSNGEKEEGKYKNNVLITNPKKRHLFLMRSAKFRERLDGAVSSAQRSSKIAMQKADIAISRTATARGKAEQADILSAHAHEDSDVALVVAKQYAPDFKQPGLDRLKAKREKYADFNNQKDSISHNPGSGGGGGAHITQNSIPVTTNPTLRVSVPKLNSSTMNLAGHQQQTQAQVQTHMQLQHAPTPHSSPQKTTPQHNQIDTNPSKTMHNNPNYLSPTSNKQPTDHADQINAEHIQEHLQKQLEQLKNQNRGGEPQAPARRGSALSRGRPDRPYLGSTSQQSSIDHFDHYKRPPSRDSSVDRYSRATGRAGGNIGQPPLGSRQPSLDRAARQSMTPDRQVRAPSQARGTTPAPMRGTTPAPVRGTTPAPQMRGTTPAPTPPPAARNGSIVSGNAKTLTGNGNGVAVGASNQPPFEEILLTKRSLGQDIIPSPNQPKRTESLYNAGGGAPGAPAPAPALKNIIPPTTLSRKKSLPEFQELPKATSEMSREEVSALGSARREEVRRQADEKDRLRANPLLYLISPQMKDWFSRQQLVIVILFVNISLAIMFFKLLT